MLHKKISDLEFSVQKKFQAAWDAMNASEKLKEMGVDSVAIAESKRDLTTQMAYFVRGRMDVKYVKQFYAAAGLYEIGETEARTVCTNTLRSNHMTGRACDFVPVRKGATWWNAPQKVWETMGAIGEANGLKWGGRWKDFPDSPHFEV
ncbi:MAG: M15 family metallopeptidase [Treponema sp.]|nr:M15 family metallopeptidase [Treponema sp.]